MRALITGVAGFIGFHLARRLLSEGWRVTGLDGLTDYYDIALKRSRLAVLEPFDDFRFAETMLEYMAALERAAEDAGPDVIVHLAAQAGVRHSLEAPRRYIESNLVGTFNVLEIAKAVRPRHFLHA
ncbi:MAG: NAD-dependent epimerase/dehydratase family protein, partial [Caulobacteraceae bacterium]